MVLVMFQLSLHVLVSVARPNATWFFKSGASSAEAIVQACHSMPYPKTDHEFPLISIHFHSFPWISHEFPMISLLNPIDFPWFRKPPPRCTWRLPPPGCWTSGPACPQGTQVSNVEPVEPWWTMGVLHPKTVDPKKNLDPFKFKTLTLGFWELKFWWCRRWFCWLPGNRTTESFRINTPVARTIPTWARVKGQSSGYSSWRFFGASAVYP